MRHVSATAELVYQEAVEQAQTYRRDLVEAHPDTGTFVASEVRVWDLYYPDWNCLLVKERLGEIGESILPKLSSTFCHVSNIQILNAVHVGSKAFALNYCEVVHALKPAMCSVLCLLAPPIGCREKVHGREKLSYHPLPWL